MCISSEKSKVIAFRGRFSIRSKIVINNGIVEQVEYFNLLESGIYQEIEYFNKPNGTIKIKYSGRLDRWSSRKSC